MTLRTKKITHAGNVFVTRVKSRANKTRRIDCSIPKKLWKNGKSFSSHSFVDATINSRLRRLQKENERGLLRVSLLENIIWKLFSNENYYRNSVCMEWMSSLRISFLKNGRKERHGQRRETVLGEVEGA